MPIREQAPLSLLTTLGVGGPARYFLEAVSESDVLEGVEFARSKQLPLFILGGGSNLVVSDRGFDGVVLKIALRGVERTDSGGDDVAYRVSAGEEWDSLVARAVDADCAGIECLSGIPGTVGGTPIQNVGAYGQEVSSTIREVEAFDLHALRKITFTNSACRFGYRTSRFNTTDSGQYIILRVTFSLRRGGNPSLRYADLHRHFAKHMEEASLAKVRSAVLAIRHSKAMLIIPGEEDANSAGSFFKNPILTTMQFEELASRLASRGTEMPSYPAGEGLLKVPAAWLVEQAGFSKGYGKGAAGISRQHTLAIVNRGGATAAEIVALKDDIQKRVLHEFGLQLQPEPVFVGF